MTPFVRFFLKLYARCVTCIAVAAAVACGSIIWLVDQDTRESGQQALRSSTAQATKLVRPFLEGRNDRPVAEILARLAERTDMRFTLAGSDGAVLVDTEQNPALMDNVFKRQEIHAARVLGTGLSTKYVAERDELAAYVALPVYGSNGALLGYVRGFTHIPARYAAAQGDRKSDLVALILIGGLALALAVVPVLGTYFTFRRMA